MLPNNTRTVGVDTSHLPVTYPLNVLPAPRSWRDIASNPRRRALTRAVASLTCSGQAQTMPSKAARHLTTVRAPNLQTGIVHDIGCCTTIGDKSTLFGKYLLSPGALTTP